MKGRAVPALMAGVAAALLLCLALRWRQGQVCQEQLFAMDTVMRFTAYGPHARAAVSAAMAEVERLDALLSTGNPDSEVSRLNRDGGGTVSADTLALLKASARIYEDTGGLFDCSVYPLMELWGFPSGEYQVPSDGEITAALALVDGSRVRTEGEDRAVLEAGQRIDFGGIAKGYAAQRVIEIYQAHGVKSGMVSLGGNVQTLGTKPDGSPWRIGVRDPEGVQGAYLGVLPVTDRAVVTSGGYERYFQQDGQTYIHILDPRSGRPAESDLLSVTVVSSDGTAADGLSTALFIMGREGAARYWRDHSEDLELVLVARDGAVYVSPGLQDSYQSDRPFRTFS